jgi:hypothetical protein
MRLRLAWAVALAVTASVVFAGNAPASGPAPPGKDLVSLTCEQLGPVTVAVPRSDNNNGAGQLVGMKGHGIGVAFTFTITDVTKDMVIDSEASAVGKGHAHPNQSTVNCSGVLFSAPASEFFGGDPLPPGVDPGDTIEAGLSGQVIPKL